MDLETSETGIKCVHCGRNCSDEDKFLTHIKTHLFENGFYYPCLAGCPKRFKNLKTYKKHKKKCQPIQDSETNAETTQRLYWQCQNCPEQIDITNAKNQKELKKVVDHCYEHSRNREVVSCPSCNKPWTLYKSLNRHINEHKHANTFSVKVEGLVLEEASEEVNVDQVISDTDSDIEQDTSIHQPSDSNLNEGSDNNQSNSIDTADSPALPSISDVLEMNSSIEHNEIFFALKCSSKHLLSQAVVNEIFSYSAEIHTMKMEFLKAQLLRQFGSENSGNIEDVIKTINLIDNNAGCGDEALSTHLRREQLLRSSFDFIKPEKVVIKTVEGKITKDFYYSLPIKETLSRLISDDSVRDLIVHKPTFNKNNENLRIYNTFSDGNLIRNMEIVADYALLRLFFDAFASNNSIGSSSHKHKIMGSVTSVLGLETAVLI